MALGAITRAVPVVTSIFSRFGPLSRGRGVQGLFFWASTANPAFVGPLLLRARAYTMAPDETAITFSDGEALFQRGDVGGGLDYLEVPVNSLVFIPFDLSVDRLSWIAIEFFNGDGAIACTASCALRYGSGSRVFGEDQNFFPSKL